MVRWQGDEQELGRTPTVYNTVHPVWKACSFELPLGALKPDSEPNTCGANNGDRSNDVGRCTDVHSNRKEGKSASELAGECGGKQEAEIELNVQVWDEDDGVGGDFLGEVTFGAEELLEIARGGQTLVSILYIVATFDK